MKIGNKNIFSIPRNKVPSGNKIMYANPVWNYCPYKDDPYHIRLTIGSDMLPYPSDSGSPAATLLKDIFFQQHNFNPWFLIYFGRYQGLFSLISHGTLRIYQNIFPLDFQINTHTWEFIISCWTWQLHVLISNERRVRIKIICPYCLW